MFEVTDALERNGDGGSPEGGYRATHKTKDYYWCGVTRGFAMCQQEKILGQNITEIIDTEVAVDGCSIFGDPDGTKCGGKFRDIYRRWQECSAERRQLPSDKPRRVTPFTLKLGPVSVIQLDWICGKCGYLNYYRGNQHGIFPSRCGVSFSVELMYWWVH